MGYYVNPANQTKEDWLAENGVVIGETEALGVVDSGTDLPVCIVDNGPFTAAGIGYSREEVTAFQQPDDYRPRMWFSVPRDLLLPFMSAR